MKEKQESLLQAMEKEAYEERKKLEEAYLKQVREIKENAEKEVRRLREEETRLVDQKLAQERARLIGKADQEVRNHLLLAKHKVVEEVLAGVEKELLKLREEKGLYQKLLWKLLIEALTELPGEVVVKVNPVDRDPCQAVLKEQNRDARIEGDNRIVGGVVLVGHNGRTTILNSLQSRISKGRELAMEEVARVLFKEAVQ
jgi:vacuolar-type H+-ATPase subunit E/Vma4